MPPPGFISVWPGAVIPRRAGYRERQMHTLRTLLLIGYLLGLVATNAFALSEEPLKKAAIEPARVLVEAVGISNWLNANHSRMDPGQTQGAREHLHALIDSRVKELYAKTGMLLPKEPDPILAMLYSWAGRLGVYGADPVYAAVRGTFLVKPPPGPQPPDGLAVGLQKDMLTIASSAGEWRATVPYHFFIFALNSAPTPDSKLVETVAISTGSAPDIARPGYSQATIALIFVAGADPKSFEKEWADRLGVPLRAEPRPVGETRYRSRTAHEAQNRLHKEVVFVPSRKGSFAILYSGLDGTYQTNRPHFLNFLEAIQLPE